MKVYFTGIRKRTIGSMYLHSTDHVGEEDIRDLLNQLSPPIILRGNFNAHIAFGKNEKKTSTRGRC